MGILDVAEPVVGLWLHSKVSDRLLLLAPEGAHAVGKLDSGIDSCKQKVVFRFLKLKKTCNCSVAVMKSYLYHRIPSSPPIFLNRRSPIIYLARESIFLVPILCPMYAGILHLQKQPH